ncbi:hypothetical protein IV203_037322 [Nitzschia inconspicua]|uniref:Uncharacterized protein n=1 Tax=Nitzschia inconspicua TaxID=303405 RepID=A0A9K3K869_9STRA|nr:hypothetical protein IV203_006356 [Nitzschia inconspicua]KAG7347234.1 hypothetical protein IV203_006303 [Nitzschia inconspicua]KAG7364120.1 hypothetical protein IV203_037322 [Nitzschia inconspicua]
MMKVLKKLQLEFTGSQMASIDASLVSCPAIVFDLKKSTKEELLRLSSSSSHLKVHPHDEDPTGTEEYAWQLFYKPDLDDNI